jgi:tetrapyrrole methylase family protein/MazG family protein
MTIPRITLLGLGPGDPLLLSRQAWQIINTIPKIILRTRLHPTVDGFPSGLEVSSFDHLYEGITSYEDVYAAIVEEVLQLGRLPGGIVYAVPGHPFIAEATCPEIARRAHQEDIPVRIVDGISFIEPTFSALGMDPFPRITMVDALELAAAHHPSIPPDAPALIAQLYSSQVAGDVKLTLMALYPDEHLVKLVHKAGSAEVMVEELPLYAIDRSPHVDLLTTLFVPPLGPATSFEAFQEIIAHLRAPDGCPWDREQTHQTLRANLLEEAYEVLTAIDADDPQAMAEEFGDLLLQIVLHTQIASEYGEFTMADVLQGVHAKLVHRHPHVFGDLDLEDIGGVLKNWELLKAEERKENGEADKGLLDGVSIGLPAMIQAQEYQGRVARVGFDWPEIKGVLDKIAEEIREVQSAENKEASVAEIGDLFFALVNLARWLEIDAESALREANARFRVRFAYIESAARSQNRSLAEFTLEEMESLWEASKSSS